MCTYIHKHFAPDKYITVTITVCKLVWSHLRWVKRGTGVIMREVRVMGWKWGSVGGLEVRSRMYSRYLQEEDARLWDNICFVNVMDSWPRIAVSHFHDP